jgi:hypothetical protein
MSESTATTLSSLDESAFMITARCAMLEPRERQALVELVSKQENLISDIARSYNVRNSTISRLSL